MKTKIIISILFRLVVYLQGTVIDSHPTGPKFVSISTTKQKLYYNNLGTTLDCSASGVPNPVLKWFRTNGTDDRLSTIVESSEFIDVFENGSLYIRPFRDYSKVIHAGTYVCRAENPAGSIQTTPVQLKPQIYDTYEIEVKNTFGFEQSSVILSCDISPPSASAFVQIIGWLEKFDEKITSLDLRPRTKYNLLSNKNLIIHNISKSDESRSYACIANNHIDNETRQSRFKPLRVRDHSPFGPELSIANHTEYRARAGDLIELPCGISSISSHARLSWWKNGVEIENLADKVYDHSLIIQLSATSANDSGHYLCRIDDESGGRLTSHMSLKVDVPNQCHMLISQTSISAGSNVDLSCTSNSDRTRLHQWRWFHNSKLILANDDRYSMNNVTRAHMGMYQCCYIMDSSDSNDCCAQAQVRVINSPPFIVDDQQTHSNVIIVESKNHSYVPIDLNCTVYADPKAHLEIVKDGQIVSKQINIDHLPSGDMFMHYRIDLSDLNDTGLYQCRATNAFGTVTLSKHINIQGQKPHLQSIPNITVVSGQEFTLACYGSGQPNLELRWIDETTNQILNTSFTSPAMVTSISTKSRSYTCHATNQYGETSTQIHVNVQVPAKILTVPKNRTIKINESIEAFCEAEGDQPLNLLLISPRMKPINGTQSNHDQIRRISLMIDHVRMSDSGQYQCYAKNNYSEDRLNFQIIVQNVPKRIEDLRIENDQQRIVWTRPFDGNAAILHYILRVRRQQDGGWSNETILLVNGTNQTFYSFEHLSSSCLLSIIVQAVNMIGSSPPSDPLRLETYNKRLTLAPQNLTAVNISSTSIALQWQYPSDSLCGQSPAQYEIQIIAKSNHSIINTYRQTSTSLLLQNLKSYTEYIFIAYALNEFGRSPPSTPVDVQTSESVPLISIIDLTSSLFANNSIRLNWTVDHQHLDLLNGKFRTFTVIIYRNFNMSTLINLETTESFLLLDHVHLNSIYFVSVSICNYHDCGPPSSIIRIDTSNSDSRLLIETMHPVHQPLLLNCHASSATWFHEDKPYTSEATLKNGSLYIARPMIGEHDGRYQCQSNAYDVHLYNKPSMIQARIHYASTNEIGIKIHYPPEVIKNLTVMYQTRSSGINHEMHMSPPSPAIRLSNLICGSLYEIIIHASNEAGSSIKEYIFGRTEGSIPQLIEPTNLLETVSTTSIVLNMTHWKINQCSIISYEIEVFSSMNTSENRSARHFFYPGNSQKIQIEDLQPNRDYQLHLRVKSEAGEIIQVISFRTSDNRTEINNTGIHLYLIIVIVIIAVAFIIIVVVLICIFVKICRERFKNSDLFITRTRKLKPMIYSSYPDHYHGTWLRSNNEFTIENYAARKMDDRGRPCSYASEDSQGNINPYAVTGCVLTSNEDFDRGPFWKENKHAKCLIDTVDHHATSTSSERYFRPIILESSSLQRQESCQRNPLVQLNSKSIPANSTSHPVPPPSSAILPTVSSSQGELFSAFTYVMPSKQTTLNTKKFINTNPVLADQSSSSADSGVHSSCAQSPITKHSFRRSHFNGFSFDRPSSAHLHEDQDKHFYATYDQQFAFLRETSSHHPTLETATLSISDPQQEQYSLV